MHTFLLAKVKIQTEGKKKTMEITKIKEKETFKKKEKRECPGGSSG